MCIWSWSSFLASWRIDSADYLRELYLARNEMLIMIVQYESPDRADNTRVSHNCWATGRIQIFSGFLYGLTDEEKVEKQLRPLDTKPEVLSPKLLQFFLRKLWCRWAGLLRGAGHRICIELRLDWRRLYGLSSARNKKIRKITFTHRLEP